MRGIETERQQRIRVSPTPVRFLGRQPIVDAAGNIFGHELLFRSGETNVFTGDAEDGTRDVIDHCLLLMEESREASFINCTRKALLTGIVTLLPPHNTVLEILEDVVLDPDLLDACKDLKKKGYRFALDDFLPEESKLPFLEVVDFIKIDFLACDPAMRDKIYVMASSSKARFLAEKVETEADVQMARAEGCELFQGYFFSKPIIVTTRVIPQNHAVYLQLLAALTRTPTEVSDLEKLILSDASLSYRLLRLVNSTMYALPSPVSSIRSALLIVGDDEFKKLVTVALTNRATTRHSKGVVRIALMRAKFCEMIAPSMNESASRLYLLGLLSLVDVMLGISMTQILSFLPLDHEMKNALLGEKNSLSIALDFARCHESGDWDEHVYLEHALGIANAVASKIYVDALQWADRMTRAMI